MTVLRTPVIETSERVSLPRLWHRARMGVIGMVLVQFCGSLVYGMGAVYAAKRGLSVPEVALFMGSLLGGAVVVQWPLARLSDAIDRRWVLGGASVIAAVAAVYASAETMAGPWLYTAAFVFGGFCLSQYSLVVALIHDHLRPSEITHVSGTIALVSGLVSVAGPLSISLVMANFGLASYFQVMAVLLGLMAVIAFWRVLTIPALPPEYKTTSTLQAPVAAVGTVLHAEDKDPVQSEPDPEPAEAPEEESTASPAAGLPLPA